jgi:putative MFS transporter
MNSKNRALGFTVLVAALGYFVDIYDLLLFGIVRRPSLQALGVPEEQMLDVGVHLLNMQMVGMLLGGILWGVIGDKRGRKSVLFGSILLYSLCNIANAFVPNPEVYGWLRFLAGIGLAGELGAAITLVSEIMPQATRGYGTSVVAAVGILGAVLASLVGDFFNWQVAYLVGGGMGLGLLGLRAGLLESPMFKVMSQSKEVRGAFHKLFSDSGRALRYVCCILVGMPIWYVIGILITFAPELAHEIGVTAPITGSNAIMWCYLGASIGDLSTGLLSQYLRSRKKTVLLFVLFTFALILVYSHLPPVGAVAFYSLCALLGLGTGYWAIFVTIAAEQFGTNIRATVTTTVPNFVRGSVVPLTLAFRWLSPQLGTLHAVLVVGVGCVALALAALIFLQETFHKELDYFEAL